MGPDGAPWITDGGPNAIVRVDPRTREVTRWPLPEARGNANLNTATFDKQGRSGSPARTGSTAASTRRRRDAGLGRAAWPRAVRHHHHARRRRLLRLARRQPHRADRRRDGRGNGHRAADQGPGRAARLVRLEGARSGSASGTRGRSAGTTRGLAPGRRGSCRATGRRPTQSTSTTRTRCG